MGEQLAAQALEIGAKVVDFALRQKNRHQLIAAFAHLVVHVFEVHLLPVMPERFSPRFHVKVVGIDERSVDIQNRSFDQDRLL